MNDHPKVIAARRFRLYLYLSTWYNLTYINCGVFVRQALNVVGHSAIATNSDQKRYNV